MKKTLTAIAALMLIVGVMLSLVSCGGLSGTYDGTLFDLKFKGEKVTVIAGEYELDGTYKLEKDDDGNKYITFDFIDEDKADEEQKQVLKIVDALLSAKLPYSESDGTLTIGKGIASLKFTKK